MASGFSLSIANIAVGMLRWCGDEMVWGCDLIIQTTT